MQFTVDGKAAFATTGGRPFDASLPAIVFIHGASFNATVWKLMTRYFAWRDRAVLALDLPGHGRSEGAGAQLDRDHGRLGDLCNRG